MKRALDLILCIVLATPAAVAMAVIAGLTLAIDGRPVFFRQQRVGLNERRFRLVKFRTMAPGEGEDAERLTTWGRTLRSTSLDELPQIWNVVRGDMSLVGPRPLLVQYLPRYTDEQRRRHLTRPGITGWAQVHGRNALGWEEKFKLDVWYVDHRTLGLDMKILVMTVFKVLSGRGISQPGHSTMPEFMGSEDTSAK